MYAKGISISRKNESMGLFDIHREIAAKCHHVAHISILYFDIKTVQGQGIVDIHNEVAAKCHHVTHNQSILLIPRVFLYQESTRAWDCWMLIYIMK